MRRTTTGDRIGNRFLAERLSILRLAFNLSYSLILTLVGSPNYAGRMSGRDDCRLVPQDASLPPKLWLLQVLCVKTIPHIGQLSLLPISILCYALTQRTSVDL
jgi:hypothetical protein